MPSTSKSNRRKPKAKFIPKPKQEWRVKEPKRNWLELPTDVMANILYKVGVYDILENAQKVCTTWRKICKDPAMWRVIYMHAGDDRWERHKLRKMCKHAVVLSQGQLVEITIKDFPNRDLLNYVGLQAILDGCHNLELLDLRQCLGIDLEGDLGKRCLEKMKCLKLPNDSLVGCDFGVRWDLPEDFVSGGSDDEYYDEYFDYDDYTDPFHPDYRDNHGFGVFDSDDDYNGIEDVNDMLAYMAFFG